MKSSLQFEFGTSKVPYFCIWKRAVYSWSEFVIIKTGTKYTCPFYWCNCKRARGCWGCSNFNMLAQLLQEICAEFYIKFSAYCLQRTHGIINSSPCRFPGKVQVSGSRKIWWKQQSLGKSVNFSYAKYFRLFRREENWSRLRTKLKIWRRKSSCAIELSWHYQEFKEKVQNSQNEQRGMSRSQSHIKPEAQKFVTTAL